MNVDPGSRDYNTHMKNSYPKGENSTLKMKKLTSKGKGTTAINRSHDMMVGTHTGI